MNHIAEGTDHLLFLLTLLLPAPLCVIGRRWATAGRPGRSILQIAKIVSAFTLGHSVTLLLGALEPVHVLEPPIEVLIAASILVSAVHAMRPLFPGREYVVAAGFGLVHGQSFAVVHSALRLDQWDMTIGIFGFNLGIQTM
ncbi:MAG: HupE/UreJ family protein [Janthinobacterium lividum]